MTDLHLRHWILVPNNNQMEIVIVPVDHDEKMAKALDLLEHMEIHRLVTRRGRKKQKTTVPLEALLKKQDALTRFQPRHP
ncbi:hypothetical protein [Nitrospira sp. BLG_1]|uniref:hypothetical protein n=1 Tax=Nitrospira sp. BLG_1 TaxID=3395883 RepID=UPI0039BD2B5A